MTGDSLKEFFFELERIRGERVSDKEINDAKSYLTGVFPIRLETQEGLIDQLVQIKMLNLPITYLETYRDRVQAVTIDDILRVANLYVRPDESALIVVGDGSAVLDQIKPYCEDIEAYTTGGKKKEHAAGQADATDVVGAWAIEVETPMGQAIPATLTITDSISNLSAKITSEMGDADLGTVEIQNGSFEKATSIDMDGHSVPVEISVRFEDENIEGTLTMQGTPLPFTGSKAS